MHDSPCPCLGSLIHGNFLMLQMLSRKAELFTLAVSSLLVPSAGLVHSQQAGCNDEDYLSLFNFDDCMTNLADQHKSCKGVERT